MSGIPDPDEEPVTREEVLGMHRRSQLAIAGMNRATGLTSDVVGHLAAAHALLRAGAAQLRFQEFDPGEEGVRSLGLLADVAALGVQDMPQRLLEHIGTLQAYLFALDALRAEAGGVEQALTSLLDLMPSGGGDPLAVTDVPLPPTLDPDALAEAAVAEALEPEPDDEEVDEVLDYLDGVPELLADQEAEVSPGEPEHWTDPI